MENNNVLKEFYRIIKDFIKDLIRTFPDKITETTNKNLYILINDEDINIDLVANIYDFCKDVYPKQFFNILYEHEELFQNKESIELLPGINFIELWNENITENTKSIIWKYLQLILFYIVNNLDSDKSFGNTAKLFEAINQDEFKNKIEETIEQMNNVFNFNSNDNNSNKDDNNDDNNDDDNDDDKDHDKDHDNSTNYGNLPNVEELHSHINQMMEGKLGCLAKEIAEETANDLDINTDNIESVNDVFKQLFKNPGKLMDIVKNVGSKLDDKIQSGNIKESELLEEASELVNKMKSMPGLGDFENMFSKMGIPGLGKGAKVDMNAFGKQMEQNLRTAKMRDRMRSKLQEKEVSQNKSTINTNPDNLNTNPDHLNIDDMKKFVFSTGDTIDKSNKPTNKKKKKKGKKK